MNDLISRQAAIDALLFGKEMLSRALDDMDVDNTEREKFSWGHGLIESNIYDIEELPSAQQWIPCSERLPENEDTYLVTFDKGNLLDEEEQVSYAYWINNQWQYGVLESYEHRMPKLVIEPCEELKVTAWMPLPEPYKGEES